MIKTLVPFGAIKESEIAFIFKMDKNKFFLIDINGNRWKISEDTYRLLDCKDIPIKEEK